MSIIKTLAICGFMFVPAFAAAQGCCKEKTEKTSCCGRAEDCQKQDNDVIRTIMSRRSIRKYKDRQVEHEKLATIARCGINAPNGMNQQPWVVRVVESPDFIKGTTEIFKKENPEMVARDANFRNMYRNAPNIIVVATPKGRGQVDAGLMGENMMLAAHSLGLGTCCLGGVVRFLQSSEACRPYLDRLNIPAGYEICYIIAVGYPDETPDAKPRDEGKIEYVK